MRQPSFTQMRYAMGTLVEIRSWGQGSCACRAAAEAAFAQLRRLEGIFSRFQESSQLSRLNRLAAHQPVRVGPELFEVLCTAQEVARRTDGAFDVTSGAWTALWDRAERQGRLPSDRQRSQTLRRIGWRRLCLDPETRQVRFTASGLQIDLGAIAKGYAVDRCVELLQRHGVPQGLVDAGGNFRIFGFDTLQAAGVEDPQDPHRLWGTVELILPAISSSSHAWRHRSIAGEVTSHVLDPRSGEPLKEPAGVTVLADSACLADALSTAVLVLGRDGLHTLHAWQAQGLWIHPNGFEVSPGLAGHVECQESSAVRT